MKKPYIICMVSLLVFMSACAAANMTKSPESAPSVQYSYNTGGGAAAARDEAAYYHDGSPEMELAEAKAMGDAAYYSENQSAPAGGELRPEKIIKSGFIELTSDHFDNDKSRLEVLTLQMGGFIEQASSYSQGDHRRYEAVIRVPGERFSEMKKAVEETGRLISSSENSDNVTGQYYDMESRLAIKRVEEERILAMIEKAENVETILVLEEHLGAVRTDIEMLVSQMNNIDNLSAYSTLNVNLTEGVNVKIIVDTGNFGQKLWQNLKYSASGTAEFFGNVLVFLAGAVIPLALTALLIFTGIYAGRKLRWGKNTRLN